MNGQQLFPVHVERNVLVPLSDGIALAGDLFLPEGAGPVPALVSYYPYHKDDLIGALFDHPNRYFTAHGYASLLVDLRGLGNSEGVAWDVGDAREATDGAEIVEWAAAQPWCDGNVGMWGMSYGGITALKAAAVRPPHLRAIVPMNASLDQYEDVVYPGGCFNCLGMIGGWGPFMTAMNLTPPMYQDPEGRWYRVWRERLEKGRAPYIMPYQEHPAHDDYWASKRTDAKDIEVPVFLIGGWRDIFPEVMVRAYERIEAPRRLLMGPWMHEMPDLASFARVDYLAEMTRWWDRWLKGFENGIDGEPPVTIYVQGVGWRQEWEWPVARAEAANLYLSRSGAGPGSLAAAPGDEPVSVLYGADPTVGVTAGLWDPTGTGLGAPLDQGPDDLRSIVFTGDPLPGDLVITGSPDATLQVALVEGDDVNLVVKLCDVAADGHSALITTGWLKGSHRGSNATTEAIPSDQTLEFCVPLWATSYRVPAGHRLRVSIACADFPRVWPTRINPLIRLTLGGDNPSRVRLPIVGGMSEPNAAPPVPDSTVQRAPLDIEATPVWTIDKDLASGGITVTTGIKSACFTPSRDGRFQIERRGWANVSPDRPDGARVEGEAMISLETPTGARVVVEGRLQLTLDGQDFAARVTVDGLSIYDRQWSSRVSPARP